MFIQQPSSGTKMTQHLMFWLFKYELVSDLERLRRFGLILRIRLRVLLYYTVTSAFRLGPAAGADENPPVMLHMRQNEQ